MSRMPSSLANASRHRPVSLHGDQRAGLALAARGAHFGAGLRLARSRYSRHERAASPILPGAVGPMTDFLTRLAQTIHGLQTQIQPLIASRYAPGPELSPLNETGASEENFNQARPAVPQSEEA